MLATRLERIEHPEMMDHPDLHPGLLNGDLRNLEALNRLFGGRGVVRQRLGVLLAELSPGEPVSLLDIGSGAGDLCRLAVDLCRRTGHPVHLTSVDAHHEIQEYARSEAGERYPEIEFLPGDAREVPLRAGSVDLAICTLALHHFARPDAVAVLSEMWRVSRRWTLLSDLCRSSPAYWGVWLATRFTPNKMTRYDGPTSVRRAYTEAELRAMADEAGWKSARFYREAWFRMSLVGRKAGRW